MHIIRSLMVFLLLAAMIFGVLLWNNLVLQTETIEVRIARLPPRFEGLRIACLADLHGREFEKDNHYLLASVRSQCPDLICISGDLFDEPKDLPMLKPLIEGLCAIAPTFYVTGNHEWQVENLALILRQMECYGVTVLRNEYVILQRENERLVIAGVDDPCGPYDQKTPQELVSEIRRAEGEDACIVMLAHRNDRIDLWAELGVDLVLSGHCHGGVVRLPLVGGVFGTNRELFPDYDAGLYEKERTQLFVSRGLGYTNVRFRLFNRPHLPLLILHK